MSVWPRLSVALVVLSCIVAVAVGRKSDAKTAAVDNATDSAPHNPNSRGTSSARLGAGDEPGAQDPESIAEEMLAAQAAERERKAHDRELYQELKNKTERSAMESHLMRNLEETSRYPASNQRFASRAHDPVARRNGPDRRNKKSDDGRSILSVWASATQIDLGAKFEVFAEFSEMGAAGPVVRSDRGLVGLTLVREDLSEVANIPLESHAGGPYTALLNTANVAGRPLEGGFYKLVARGPENLRAITAFDLRPAYAKLTGNYRDAQRDGALIIEAEIEAYEAGRFIAMATLYTDDDIPIGTAQAAERLSSGRHWVALTFSGLLVRDGGRNGPYRLGHIAIDKQDMPVVSGVHAAPNHKTAAYNLTDFSAEPDNRLDALAEDSE